MSNGGSSGSVEVVELVFVDLAVAVGIGFLDVLGHILVQRLGRHISLLALTEILDHQLNFFPLEGPVFIVVVFVEQHIHYFLELVLVHAQPFVCVAGP
jgi:hypothetical protein